MDSPVEVKSVATSGFVVPRLHVFESVGDSASVISHVIVECYSETTRLLSKEIAIVLNGCDLDPCWQEIFWKLLVDDVLVSMVKKFKLSTQEIWLKNSYIVLSIHCEVTWLAADNEFSHLS